MAAGVASKSVRVVNTTDRASMFFLFKMDSQSEDRRDLKVQQKGVPFFLHL
jgi:hypothetical protein